MNIKQCSHKFTRIREQCLTKQNITLNAPVNDALKTDKNNMHKMLQLINLQKIA